MPYRGAIQDPHDGEHGGALRTASATPKLTIVYLNV